MAYNCVERGPLFGTVLNAAKEIALDKFISGEIKFLDITYLVKRVLDSKEISDVEAKNADKFEDILTVDSLTREVSKAIRLN